MLSIPTLKDRNRLTMTTYLFVTKPEYTPERVADGVDIPWWSCSSTTKRGDFALVYVTGVGIQYEWQVVSDAEPHDEWKYICDVTHSRTFASPITLDEICAVVTKTEWAPPHLHFRGYQSITIPDAIADRIRSLSR
jgi:hypothetical protein